MELSDNLQKQKRIFLSLFATEIFVSSLQFKKSWEDYLKKTYFWKIFFRKKIYFDRMGIYIPRVLNREFSKEKICQDSVPHLIFMSRITGWKGFTVFSDISKKLVSSNLHSLVLTTKNDRSEIFNEAIFKNGLNHVIYESGVSNINLGLKSVHIYPTNYGKEVSYPQSIGMNVLELLAVGVPSIISPEGFFSWPELEGSKLVSTSNWADESSLASKIQSLLNNSEKELKMEAERLMPVISISNHVDRIIRRIKSNYLAND